MPMLNTWRLMVALAATLALLAVGLLLPPLHQDPVYHHFADTRSWAGVPNALNVLSNIPFALVALLALWALLSPTHPIAKLLSLKEKLPYLVFFSSIGLTACGSAYYHWQPNSQTLFWDRLPLSIGFMALLCAILSDRLHPRLGLALLIPLCLLGAASVVYWAHGNEYGQGDLRPYVVVQFGGLFLILLITLLFPRRLLKTAYLLQVMGWYAAAKVCETYDAPIFHFTQVVSGHTLKHLTAALASYWVLKMLQDAVAQAPALPADALIPEKMTS